ncbi:MAG: hypothetical protein E7625_04955 [Ruminococcaceae bacterium]|nr:hypothetical protein [Oscillospiraceae bacterium]
MADKTALTAPLCLLTNDGSLAHLISTEAHELALPLTVVRSWPEAMQQHAKTLLLDLDDQAVRDALATADGAWDMIGICRDAAALSDDLTGRLSVLIERPFSTAKLREILSERSGHTIFLTQDTEAKSASRVDTTMADGVSLTMADATTLLCGDMRIRLTIKEAALMRLLIEHRGEIVSRKALSEALQSTGRESADSNKTEVYLCFLRRKIEHPLGLRLITTVRGRGYRLE